MLAGHTAAHQTEGFDRRAFPDGVQHVGRRDGEAVEGAAFERDEASEQTRRPKERFCKDEVAK